MSSVRSCEAARSARVSRHSQSIPDDSIPHVPWQFEVSETGKKLTLDIVGHTLCQGHDG